MDDGEQRGAASPGQEPSGKRSDVEEQRQFAGPGSGLSVRCGESVLPVLPSRPMS
jgi:hypothetical protein